MAGFQHTFSYVIVSQISTCTQAIVFNVFKFMIPREKKSSRDVTNLEK